MNKTEAHIETLWKMAYDSFERRPGITLRTVFGMRNSVNAVQGRLMKGIAKLKSEPPNAAHIESIRGDLMVAQTIGFLSETDAEKFQKQLDYIAGEK